MMTNGAPETARAEPKAKVFICYARADLGFTDRIIAALEERGFEGLIDRRDIALFENWWEEIQLLIRQADTVVFVLSPEAVSSKVCEDEVAYAASLNKRFGGVVWKKVSARTIPEKLRALQWIDFEPPARFADRVAELATTLEIDIKWIRKHTEFGEQAHRWESAGRPGPDGLMLRPPLLDEAERWLADHPPGAPEPTNAIRAFIAASRAAYHQEIERLKRERDAALLTRSRFLAGFARKRNEVSDFGTALAIGLEAITDPDKAIGQVAASEAVVELDRAVRSVRERKVLRGHEGGVTSAAFNPSGTRVVTASDDETARVWNAATGAAIAVLHGHVGEVASAVFHPSGKRVVTVTTYGQVRVWDLTTGAGHDLYHVRALKVMGAVSDPLGARVLIAFLEGPEWLPREGPARSEPLPSTPDIPQSIELKDIETDKAITLLWDQHDTVNSVAFDLPRARALTTHLDDTAQLWDVGTSKELIVFRGHLDRIVSAVFNPTGTHILTASADKTPRLWDAVINSEPTLLNGLGDDVTSAVFSPSGTQVVTASRQTARVWNAASGAARAVLHGHEHAVNNAVFDPSGTRVVTASDDNTARVWDAETGAGLAVLRGHGDAVMTAVFDLSGTRVVTASRDMTARVWDAETGATIAVLRGRERPMKSAVFQPSGARILTTSDDGAVRIWDAVTGAELVVLRGFGSKVLTARFDPSGARVVTASRDKTARLWDAATGAALGVLHGHEDTVTGAVFDPSGKLVATTSDDRTARLWNAATGAELAFLRGRGRFASSPMFSQSGSRLLIVPRPLFGGTVGIWRVFPTVAALVEYARTIKPRDLTSEQRKQFFL